MGRAIESPDKTFLFFLFLKAGILCKEGSLAPPHICSMCLTQHFSLPECVQIFPVCIRSSSNTSCQWGNKTTNENKNQPPCTGGAEDALKVNRTSSMS
ncbi:hypothetical protein F5B17DRAFT_377803 [Nemania serpens]|nr:hypothetical protein F5B17DRAFT_377803 [Nemania serpens]